MSVTALDMAPVVQLLFSGPLVSYAASGLDRDLPSPVSLGIYARLRQLYLELSFSGCSQAANISSINMVSIILIPIASSGFSAACRSVRR